MGLKGTLRRDWRSCREMVEKTTTLKPMDLLSTLREQARMHLSGGLYHNTQIFFAYNSNRIEGSHLSSEQTRYLFETNTIMPTDSALNADDLVETINHFCCFDLLLERIGEPLRTYRQGAAPDLEIQHKPGESQLVCRGWL